MVTQQLLAGSTADTFSVGITVDISQSSGLVSPGVHFVLSDGN